MINTTIRNGLIPAVFATLGIAAIAFSGNCNALGLTSSTSKSSFKSLADNQDLVCKADDGEIDIDTTPNSDGTAHFLMETASDKTQTCCEVDRTTGANVKCGEFTLKQKVENFNDGDIPSNCLQETTTGGLETYRCVVSTGAPKEYWVWHLIPADNDAMSFCDSSCGNCGVAMGTPDNAKPGEYPPFGIVWQYDQYTKNGQVLLANFTGNWCHTGSFCLDDVITCDVKSAKVSLRTAAAANFTIVEVDTVQTFNGNSTSGNVPTDFLSTADSGELLVDPTKIDKSSITLNDKPLTVNSFSTNSDRNGDGFNDLRTQIGQASFQFALSQDPALYPNGNCAANPSAPILFKGTFTDGRAWIGPTTINLICN